LLVDVLERKRRRQMRIDHAALYVRDLEVSAAFYRTYFGGTAHGRYHNPCTGLMTYFLSFGEGTRLEIMTRPDHQLEVPGQRLGWNHLAFNLGSEQAVDELTTRLRDDGYVVVSGPRTTGDGYYESCVLDTDGNHVELVA
jgi:lactoylglutathione lyase